MLSKLLIIGGGFAGALAARKLEKIFAVTLVDTKDYFEFTPSILKSLVFPDYWEKIKVPHFNYLKKSKIITDKVISLSKHQAILSSRVKLKFDYALICSGSSYTSPIKEEGLVKLQRAQELSNYSERLSERKTIILPLNLKLFLQI